MMEWFTACEYDSSGITGSNEIRMYHDGAWDFHHDLILLNLPGRPNLTANGAIIQKSILLAIDQARTSLGAVGFAVGGVGIVGVVDVGGVEDHNGGVFGSVGGFSVDDGDGGVDGAAGSLDPLAEGC